MLIEFNSHQIIDFIAALGFVEDGAEKPFNDVHETILTVRGGR